MDAASEIFCLFLQNALSLYLFCLQGDELTPGFGQMSLSRQGSSEAPEPPTLYPPPPTVLSQHPPPQPSYIMPPPPSGYQPAAPHPHPPPPPPPPTQPIMQTAPPAQGYMQPPPPPQQVGRLTPVVRCDCFQNLWKDLTALVGQNRRKRFRYDPDSCLKCCEIFYTRCCGIRGDVEYV